MSIVVEIEKPEEYENIEPIRNVTDGVTHPAGGAEEPGDQTWTIVQQNKGNEKGAGSGEAVDG